MLRRHVPVELKKKSRPLCEFCDMWGIESVPGCTSCLSMEDENESLEGQLLKPRSVSELCPELQKLYEMSTAEEPSLPFPLKKEHRHLRDGSSA